MKAKALNIQKFDIANATGRQWDDFTALRQVYFMERGPGEAIPSQDLIRKEMEVENQPERNKMDIWLVYDLKGKAIAFCQLYRLAPPADDYEAQKHLLIIAGMVPVNG